MEGQSLKRVALHAVIDSGIARVSETRRLFSRMTI
jgi:ABC-type branched-subunit amino acid transport system ATPase component